MNTKKIEYLQQVKAIQVIKIEQQVHIKGGGVICYEGAYYVSVGGCS